MTEMSAAEAATVARFEAGVPAPESWDGGLREAIAQTLADSDASAHGTCTWGECGWELRDDYRRYADAVLALPEVAALRAKAAAADRVRELHHRIDNDGPAFCEECAFMWPCPTTRELDGPSPC